MKRHIQFFSGHLLTFPSALAIAATCLACQASTVPLISGFSPLSGTNGTVVTIAGTNFSAIAASNIVYFGAVKAPVQTANPGSVTVTVPSGALYGPISVNVGGLTAYSASFFRPSFVGNGSGLGTTNFAAGFSLGAGTTPGGTAVGDLDGDGKPDLVVANNGDGTIWIYRNISTNGVLGANSFAAPVIFSTGGSANNPVLADLSGSGRLDLVEVDNQNNRVSVFQNFCTPGVITTNSFGARVDFPVGQGAVGVAAGDLNGDGLPDLVTANQSGNSISVLRNLGSAGLITSNSFAAHVDIPTGTGPTFVAIGDLDGDGKPDIATENIGASSVSLFRNLGNGGVIGTNSFAPRVDLTGGGGGEEIVLGDVDGDGKLDLLTTAFSARIFSVYRNISVPGSLGTNSFAPRVDFSPGGWVHRVALGDFEGDGKLDLTATTQSPDQFLVYRNVGVPGSFSNSSLVLSVSLGVGSNPNATCIVDLDGDGRPDIYFENGFGNNVMVYQNLTPFSASATPPSITGQPANQTVAVGGTAAFNVTATGTGPLSYQWFLNQSNLLAGATNATLTLANAQLSQAGSYSVMITNVAGFTNSTPASLNVEMPSCDPAPSGIIAWWPGNGNGNDIVGGYNASVPVGVTYTNAEVGLGFGFDGNEFLTVADAPPLNPTNAITVECWAYTHGAAGHLVGKDSGCVGGAREYLLEVGDSPVQSGMPDVRGTVWLTSGAVSIDSSAVLQNNTWYHLAMTYDGANFTLYLNGAVAGRQAASGPLVVTTEPVRIGGGGDGGCPFYNINGAVDEPTIYKRALSSNEIAAIYQAGSAGKCAPTPVAPMITAQPAGQTVLVGGTASFSVTATGTAPLSYQWFLNQSNLLAGATNAILTLANVQLSQAGNYSVMITNVAGFTNSAAATLKVNPLTANIPIITGFSPTTGTNGTLVTIAGTNFSAIVASNIVYFGSVKAPVQTANPGSLTVTVPSGALYGPISVNVGGLTAYSASFFKPAYVGNGASLGANSFGPGITLPAGTTPAGTAVGDLDGDGKPDLVVVNVNDGTIWIYRNISNNGTLSAASFAAPVILSAGGSPNNPILADLSGSGRLDIVEADSQNNRVSVFQNFCTPGVIKTNSFGARVDFPAGQGTVAVAVGDLNGDGLPDLVTANQSDNTISVLQNLGSAGLITSNSFAAHLDIACGTGTAFVAIGDLDGDGTPDIATENIGAGSVSVFRNLGLGGAITTGSLAPRVDLPGVGGGEEVVIGDVDGDGKLDLLATAFSAGAFSVYRNISVPGSLTTNSFAPRVDFFSGTGTHRVALGDFEGNGKLDITATVEAPPQLLVYKNLSTPGFFTNSSLAAPVMLATGSNPNATCIADLDGDGRPDIYFENGYGNNVMIYQTLMPAPPVITVQPTNQTVLVGGSASFSITATGAMPLSYQWYLNQSNLLAGATNATLVLAGAQLSQAGSYSVTVSNVAGSTNSVAAVLTVNPIPGVPVITAFTPLAATIGNSVTITGTNFSAIAASDIVYFGAVRATVVHATANSLTVNVPAGATYAPITVTVNGLTAWANAAFMPTFNTGASNTLALAPRLDLPAGNGPGQALFADVDGDGKPDLIVNSGSSAQFLSIYRNISTNGALIGAASFAPRVDVLLPGPIENGVFADLDGDGKLDFAVLDRTLGQVHILKNVSTPGNITSNSLVLEASLPTGSDPRGIVVRDLDGDGLPDIAVANWGDSTVMVFHNLGTTNGLGTNSFATPVVFNLPVGTQPQDLKAADLDGDGKPDLATANNNYGTTNSVTLLLNISSPGNISFATPIPLAGDATAYCLAIGDMDGDGKPDLVVSSFDYGQAVSVYRNLSSPGSLSFAPNVDFGLPGWGNGVAIGDLNGDGKPDLAVVTQLGDSLTIFLNTSTPGSFTASSLAPGMNFSAGYNPNGVAICDIDGDGRPDIACAVDYAATVSVYQNLTAPAVSVPSTNPPVIVSINPPIADVGSNVVISGNYFSPTAASDIVRFGAVQANVSAATATSLTVTVPAGAIFGPITVTAGGLTAYSMQMFEPTFLGDGSSISSSSFAPSFDIPTTGGPGSTILADLDGDGKPDIAFVTDANIVCILQNISTNGALLSAASFAPPVFLQFPTNGTSGNAYRLRAVDLDGDGRLDLIACEVSGNRVSVFHNISTPGPLSTNSFEPSFALISGNDCRFAAGADLDADGRVDIVALNYGDKTISLFKNIGTPGVLNAGSFAPPVVLPAPGGPYEVAIADLDGDGKLDLAVANADNNTVSIYQNQTAPGEIDTNSFAPRIDLPSGTSPETIAAVDVDGDGKLDLVSGSIQSDNINVYLNVSTGGLLTSSSFAPPVNFGAPGWVHTVSVADFNGDGKPDIGIVGELPSYMGIFQNTSTPGSISSSSFDPLVTFGTGWNAWGIAAGDIDGDGRPDVVFCNYYDHNIQIYQNAMPFGGPPAAPAITTQPTNITVTISNTAMFAVVAAGMPLPAYQWSYDGTNIDGATGPTLVLNNVQPSQAGNYAVLVSNASGSVLSSNAVLTVYVPPTPPTILAQTPSQIVILNSSATFNVLADGTAPLSYLWSRNGAPILGATNSSYTLPNVQLSDSGSYFSCVVTNPYGSASSTNSTLKVIDTIANSLCSYAIVITNSSYTNYQSTLKADAPGNPVPDCVDGFGHGAWYEFTAPVAGLLYVDTFGSDFDTGLAVYTGSCGSMTEVACNDDYNGVTSQVILPTSAGTTYYILAGGYDSDAGNLVLHLNHLTPPVFVSEPTNVSVVVSSNAVFNTALAGTLPMGFQWYFNSAPLVDGGGISGSLTSTLTIANVQTNEGGNYQLIASNFVGMATSTVAVLTPVILPPSFIQLPMSQLVEAGSNANFFAVVGGTPPYSYQWYFNGNPLTDDGVHIAGSVTASLNISNLTTAHTGNYSLSVSNLSGTTNATASLTVVVPPVITLQPIGRSVPPGLPTVFNSGASGIPAPGLQWQLNGTNLVGATRASYTNFAVGAGDLGSYQLVASNYLGFVTSSVAQLTFGPVAAWGRNLNNECLPPPGLSNVIQVAGSYGASYALRSDGTVVGWGASSTNPSGATNLVAISSYYGAAANNYGLRSDGSVFSWAAATPPSLSNVVAIAAGNNCGLALRAEGSVVGWGGSPATTAPAGLNHITAIALGYSHGLALRNDGTVVAWGTGLATNVPLNLANITAIAAGYTHSLALRTNGTVVAWGSGSGTNLPPGLTNITAISSEGYYNTSLSMALRSDGRVIAWGDSPYGETNPPAALSNLLSVAVAAAPYHGLALVNSGSPQILQPPVGLTTYVGRNVTLQATAVGAAPLSYQWLLNGTNIPGATSTSLSLPNIQPANAGSYQLFVSNSINTALSLPAPVNILSNNTLTFLSLSSVQSSNVYQGSIASIYGGAVLGNGPLTYQWFSAPTNKNYAAVAGGTSDTLVLNPAIAAESGFYYLAVSNQFGGVTSAPVDLLKVQFARAWGYQAVSNPPVNVTNAIAIATGGYNDFEGNYLALGADGKVYSWANYSPIYGETNVSTLTNYFITAIAAGNQDALALKSDGTVYAWGLGLYGETNPPSGLNGVVAISCGGYHDLALRYDGTVVGWGAVGQFNYGQATNNPAATNVVAISAGNEHSLALRADGTVVAWGYSFDDSTSVPFAATNVVAIAAGAGFSEALRANGTVVQWGNNIGNYPVPQGLSNIVAISASGTHASALRNNGTVVSWGYEYIGLASNNVPADVANVVAIASGSDHDFALLGRRTPAFTVQPWSRTVYNTTTSAWFSAKVVGVQPITYQWQFNGTNVPGATNDTLTVNSTGLFEGKFLPLQGGACQLIASNSYGVTASKFAQLSVLIPLNAALNASNVNWTTTGSGLWFGETNFSHDGVAAAQSGDIGPFQSSTLQATLITNVPGTCSFWWMVSSEPDFDFLQFSINGNLQAAISGSVGWQQASFPVNPGTNILTWSFSEQSIYGSGLDAGWVDQFSFMPAPVILSQPANATVNLGATVSLAVAAKGPPTMGYVWQQNGNPVGGNSPLLTLNNVSRAQDGIYSVTVTNAGGAAISSNAVVRVTVPQQLGAPVLMPDGSLQLTSCDAGGGTLSPSDLPNFTAQASSDLVNWTTLPNALSLTNGMLLLQDSSRTNYPVRYYRIIEQQ